MGLKALITGATGFIGSNLVRELLKRDWEVYAIIRNNSSIGLSRLKDLKNLNYIYINNNSFENIEYSNIPKFDACFHLAAYGVDYNQKDISQTIDANIKFTMNLLKFCKNNKTKKIINTGTCYEYGINNRRKISEDTQLNPQSYYAISKVASELMANLYAREMNLNLITVRPFGIFGEYEGLHKLVPQLMKSVILNETIKMTQGEQIRDYLYIKDLIEAYISLIETDVPNYEVFNICSGNEIRIKEFAYLISKITGCDMKLFQLGAIPYRKNEVMYFVGDNSKIKKYTNWRPKYSIEEGLKNTYEWYKENMEVLL